MNLTFRRLGVSELLPRYIFAESLFIRRRVLEVGAVASTAGASAEFLLQRGARVVLACDDDLKAVADAQSRLGSANLRFRAAVFDDLPAGGFDLVLVADLAPWVRAPALLRELVAQVSPTGSLLGGLRNPGGLSLAQLMEPDAEGAPPTYGQALDALQAHFRSVEVATQSPLLGYQLAFEKSEGLQVDGSLAGSGEAAYFVVLASQEPHRPVDPTWVQLPPAPLAFTGNRLEEVSTRAREWEERSRRLKEFLESARRDSEVLKGELAQTRERQERAEEEARRWQAQTESRERHPLQPLAQDELAARVRRLEAEAERALERAGEAERLLGVKRAELDAVHLDERQGMAQVLAAQESVRLERARREEVTRLLDDARSKLTAAYEELRGVREELVQMRAADVAGALAHAGLERPTVEERLAQARERELRLAEQHSTALAAIESLQGTAATERARAEALEQRVVWLEAERARAERAAESDAARLRALQQKAHESPEAALAESGRSTELASLHDSIERLTARAAVAEAQEKQARALADRLESELAEVRSGATEGLPDAVTEELEGLRRTGAEETARADALEAEAAAMRVRLAEMDTARQRVAEEASAVERLGESQREAERADAVAHVESLTGELQAARAAAAEAAAVAARASASEESLRGEVALARASFAEARATVGSTSGALAEAREQLAAAVAERETLLVQTAELRQRAEASEQAVRDAEEERAAEKAAAATAATGTLREQLEQAQGQLRVARALRDTLQRDLESERGRARTLAEQAVAAEARSAEVQAAVARGSEELERAKDAASTAVFERESLEQQLEASSAREEGLVAELEAVRARAESTTGEAAAQAASAQAFERELANAEAQLAALAAERAELSARAEGLADELHAERLGRVSAEEAAQAAQQQSADVARRADELQALAESAQSQKAALEELRRQLTAFQESAALAQSREAELETRVTEAQSRLDMVQRRATAQETELSALRRASGRPSAEELKSIYERAQAEISAAREGSRRAAVRPEPAATPPSEPPKKR